MVDIVGLALDRLATECATSGHGLCGGRQCEEVLRAHQLELEREDLARGFDVGREQITRSGLPPSYDWSTSALLRTVHDYIILPPIRDGLKRSIFLTTALARLGERGLPPDAIVRTGFGREMGQQILLHAAAFWWSAKAGSLERAEVPAVLQGWVDLLDELPRLAGLRNPDFADVMSVALSGASRDRSQEWLRTAAMGDLIDWRLVAGVPERLRPDEVVLPGGKDATRWVCDRFTKTYVSDWLPSSLPWELAFNRNPTRTAARVGVHVRLLQERVVTEQMVIDALSGTIGELDAESPLEGDLAPNEVVATLGSMLELGQLTGARAMARRLHEAYPRTPGLGMAYAFCSIPEDPGGATSVMERLALTIPHSVAVMQANLATCALFESDVARARAAAAAIDIDAAGSHPVWLWDPLAAFNLRAVVRFCTIADWLQDFELVGVEMEEGG